MFKLLKTASLLSTGLFPIYLDIFLCSSSFSCSCLSKVFSIAINSKPSIFAVCLQFCWGDEVLTLLFRQIVFQLC